MHSELFPGEVSRFQHVYRNEFKSWEFAKKAAQIFVLERATIAGRQGASEDKKFAAKPTRSKTNF